MTTGPRTSPDLSAAVLAHLHAQIDSAQRLFASVLAQGAAIRGRDVEAVLGHLATIKTEMTQRTVLEQQRTLLLARAGALLGISAAAVTLEAMTTLMPAQDAARARGLSSELRGLLGEIARVHGINRALMRQELAFLDHLVRLLGHEPEAGYSPAGADSHPHAHRVLDLQA